MSAYLGRDNLKKKIINIIGVVLIAASFVFIVRRFSTMSIKWGELLNPATLALLITMPFLSVTTMFLGSFCWKRSLALFTDREIYCGDTFVAYTKANLAKYLPGNVGHYAARQMFGSQMGLRQSHLVLASVFEIGYGTLSMLALSMLFSASAVITLFQERFGDNALVWVGAAIAAGVILLAIVGFAFRKNKYVAEIITLAVTPRFWLTMIGSFALSTASTLVIGALFVVIVSQYVTLDFQGAFLLVGGCVTSYFIGFVTPGVPGGIGVREAAMLLLLAPFFPSETILLAAVVQRVIMIIGDVIAFPISLLFRTNLTLPHV